MGNTLEVAFAKPGAAPSLDLLQTLTPRQLEVLAMLCEGLPNKLIARRLNISAGTVKVHIVHIHRALKVSSRLQAVVVARSAGFDAKAVAQPPTPAVPQASRILPIPPAPVRPPMRAAGEGALPLLAALMSRRLDTVPA